MADAFALLLINGRIALILFRQHISDSMFRLLRLTPLRAPSPLGGVRFRSARRRGRRGHPGKDGGEKGTGKQNRAVVRRAPPAPEFTTALVGRPNVGKSTLFNRLVQRRSAIVSEVRGTTRDRQAGIASLGDLHVRLVDTGGLEDRETVADLETIDGQVFTQAQWAVRNSDLILFVLDAKSGVTTEDMRYAQWLRVNCTHGGDKGGKGRKGGKGEDGGARVNADEDGDEGEEEEEEEEATWQSGLGRAIRGQVRKERAFGETVFASSRALVCACVRVCVRRRHPCTA